MLLMIFSLNIGLIATDMWADSETGGAIDIFRGDVRGYVSGFTYEDINATYYNAPAEYAGCVAGDWFCNLVTGASSAISAQTFGLPQFGAQIIWFITITAQLTAGYHLALMHIAYLINYAPVTILFYAVDAIIFIICSYGFIWGIFKTVASIVRGGGG
jgi:hypothetical protein